MIDKIPPFHTPSPNQNGETLSLMFEIWFTIFFSYFSSSQQLILNTIDIYVDGTITTIELNFLKNLLFHVFPLYNNIF